MANCTFDPSKTASNITLSNGNLTVTSTSATTTSSIGTLGYLSGSGSTNASYKLYWELTATTANFLGMGFANPSFTTWASNFIGEDNTSFSLGYYTNNNVAVGDNAPAMYATFGSGAVVGVAIDFFNQALWFTLDGSTWNNDVLANQNPATNIGGFSGTFLDTFWKPGGSYALIYPAWGTVASGNASTANFGASAFTHAIPAGFVAWNGGGYDATEMFFLLAP